MENTYISSKLSLRNNSFLFGHQNWYIIYLLKQILRPLLNASQPVYLV